MKIFRRILDDAGKIKGPPSHWEQYGICLLLHLTWPVLPLALERLLTGHLPPTSVMLTAFMFSIGVGISSRNQLQYAFSLVVGVITAVFFGFAVHANSVKHEAEQQQFITNADNLFVWIAGTIMALMFLLHACERYNRHVVERTPFLEIGRKEP
jgi:hypothetical protein